MTSTLSIQRVRETLDLVDARVRQGWAESSSYELIGLTSPTASRPDVLLEQLREFEGNARLSIVGEFGDARVELIVTGDALVVHKQSPFEQASFAPKYQPAVSALWAGDTSRLSELPDGSWTATAELRLSFKLDGAIGDIHVIRRLSDLAGTLQSLPFWHWSSLFPRDVSTRIVASDLESGASYVSPGLTIASLDHSWDPSLPTEDRASSAFPHSALATAPDPLCLTATAWSGFQLESIVETLNAGLVALAWLAFATRVETDSFDTELTVEFFGFQRAIWLLPASGAKVSGTELAGALSLFSWATNPNATADHLLAVRQIVSLQNDAPPWGRVTDIRPAAESVLVGLRSDAIADILRSKRELQALASEVGMKSADVSSSLTRSGIERTVASLLAVSGVIVAQSLEAITPDLAGKLRILLAAGLIFLAIWNVLMEGPLASLPIRAFRHDLKLLGMLLSESDRTDIAEMAAIRTAAAKARVVRILVPIVYVLAAVAAFAVGLLS